MEFCSYSNRVFWLKRGGDERRGFSGCGSVSCFMRV